MAGVGNKTKRSMLMWERPMSGWKNRTFYLFLDIRELSRWGGLPKEVFIYLRLFSIPQLHTLEFSWLFVG